MLDFGKVIEETGYKGGMAVNHTRWTHTSIAVTSRQQLIDEIFSQLKHLQDCQELQFTIVTDRQTHEPCRIVVVNEERL